ncbi:segregation/condensation protein A [Jeotgalibacillus proteolyticus]|uniref:Segregation and condensation protein A n=1 Tax=Jeotgalibacillus proteolyticus TaxID=2082395 RepID=A0A2S5GFK5_9BACL|nr:segregation/condensation protein A [Jeotgalibacillus proteolyticus]PPA71769.1 segregation/condensation protein A [Jeotgalibacillus proteolyticus]
MEYSVKVEAFEGPLDLLLHLIQGLEIDIYDIPMAEISEQYMLYIRAMKVMELNLASEYLVMASTLLAIKSRMLLPKHEESYEGSDIEMDEDDPRDELVERLIEYRKYKQAAIELKQKEEDRGSFYTKPPIDLSAYETEKQDSLEDLNIDLHDLLGAFHKLVRRKKLKKPMATRITRQDISIEKRMEEILVDLQRLKGPALFHELFPIAQKPHMVVSFLAVLELMKRNEVTIQQDHNFSDIIVEASKGVTLVAQS